MEHLIVIDQVFSRGLNINAIDVSITLKLKNTKFILTNTNKYKTWFLKSAFLFYCDFRPVDQYLNLNVWNNDKFWQYMLSWYRNNKKLKQYPLQCSDEQSVSGVATFTHIMDGWLWICYIYIQPLIKLISERRNTTE